MAQRGKLCPRCGVRGLVRVDDARVDGPVQVDVDVVFGNGRLGMDRDRRLFEGTLVRDLVDDRNREAQARRGRVAEFAEALDLPLLGLGTISRTEFQLRPSRPTVMPRRAASSAGCGGARSVRALREAERRPREAIVERAAHQDPAGGRTNWGTAVRTPLALNPVTFDPLHSHWPHSPL